MVKMKERLRLIRNALKLNQSEFAKQIGLTQTSLSMIESGNSKLTEKHIKLICVIFDVNESWFRTGIGEMFSSKIIGENELLEIFRSLLPETRDALLNVGKQLMKTQEKLLAGVDRAADSQQWAEADVKRGKLHLARTMLANEQTADEAPETVQDAADEKGPHPIHDQKRA
jgi:transcriptional regulator with XRE-family HTH domain